MRGRPLRIGLLLVVVAAGGVTLTGCHSFGTATRALSVNPGREFASAPSNSSRSSAVQASPDYRKAEQCYARGDYRGALILINRLLAEPLPTETDRSFLHDQRAICERALQGKSSPPLKTGATIRPSVQLPNERGPQSRIERAEPDCGPLALLYVCRYYKIPATLQELTKLCCPVGGSAPGLLIRVVRQGTTFAQLVQAAKAKGLAAEGLKVDWSYLKRMPKPVIAWVRSNHYVVILQTRWGRVHYYDPAIDPSHSSPNPKFEIRNLKSQIRNGEGVMTSRDFGEIWQGYVLTLRPR